MLELMKKHLAAYSASKWDEYRSAFSPDVAYEEIATGLVVKGIEPYIAAVQRWKMAFPDLEAKFLRGYEFGDTVVGEIEWIGTHSGPLETPFGAIPATNKRGNVKAVLISKMKDGKIIETRHYFDLLSVLVQTGIAPGLPFSTAKPAQPVAQH